MTQREDEVRLGCERYRSYFEEEYGEDDGGGRASRVELARVPVVAAGVPDDGVELMEGMGEEEDNYTGGALQEHSRLTAWIPSPVLAVPLDGDEPMGESEVVEDGDELIAGEERVNTSYSNMVESSGRALGPVTESPTSGHWTETVPDKSNLPAGRPIWDMGETGGEQLEPENGNGEPDTQQTETTPDGNLYPANGGTDVGMADGTTMGGRPAGVQSTPKYRGATSPGEVRTGLLMSVESTQPKAQAAHPEGDIRAPEATGFALPGLSVERPPEVEELFPDIRDNDNQIAGFSGVEEAISMGDRQQDKNQVQDDNSTSNIPHGQDTDSWRMSETSPDIIVRTLRSNNPPPSPRTHYSPDQIQWLKQYQLTHSSVRKLRDWLPAVTIFNSTFRESRTAQALYSWSNRNPPPGYQQSRAHNVRRPRRSSMGEGLSRSNDPSPASKDTASQGFLHVMVPVSTSDEESRYDGAESAEAYQTRTPRGHSIYDISSSSASSSGTIELQEQDDSRSNGGGIGDEEDDYDSEEQDEDDGDYGTRRSRRTEPSSGPNKHYTPEQIKWLQEYSETHTPVRKAKDWFPAAALFNSTFQENRSAQALFSCALRNATPAFLRLRASGVKVSRGRFIHRPLTGQGSRLSRQRNPRGNDVGGGNGNRKSKPSSSGSRPAPVFRGIGRLPGEVMKPYLPAQILWLQEYKKNNPQITLHNGWDDATVLFNAEFGEDRTPAALHSRAMRKSGSRSSGPSNSQRCKPWTSEEADWLTANVPRFSKNGSTPDWRVASEGLWKDLGIERSAPSLQNRWWRMSVAKRIELRRRG